MPSSAPGTVPSDRLISVWLEPRMAAVMRRVVETARTKDFKKNILVAMRFTTKLALWDRPMQTLEQKKISWTTFWHLILGTSHHPCLEMLLHSA